MANQILDENEEAELWHEYKKSKSVAIRDRLIRQYMPLVKWVAGRVSTGMPDSVEFDDLVGFGQFGLAFAWKFRQEKAQGFLSKKRCPCAWKYIRRVKSDSGKLDSS